MELKTKISIIIPVYKQWHLVNKRLWEIYQYCYEYENLEIVILDDCSDDPLVTKGMNFWVRNGTFSKIVDYVAYENVGFGQTCNKGVELSDGDIIIIHSTDVPVTGDYLKGIIEKINENPRRLVGSRLLSYDTGWNTFDGKIYPYLEGWLLACKREIWDELGGFDPRYGKFDYEDVDLSTTALSKGIELVPLNSPFVSHMSGMTISVLVGIDKRREITERNREEFRKKWVTKNE